MNVTLYEDRVLIKPDALDEKTSGGIYIPDSVKDSQQKIRATVVAHGEGAIDQRTGELTPITVKVGDRISLSKEMLWQDFEFEGEKYYLIREVDIDFIIQEKTILDSVCGYLNDIENVKASLSQLIKQ